MTSFVISGVTFIVTKEHAPWYEALYRTAEGMIEEYGFFDHAEEFWQDYCPWESI